MIHRIVLAAGLVACVSSFALADDITYTRDTRRCSANFSGNGSGSTWQDRPEPYGYFQGGVTLDTVTGGDIVLGTSAQVSSMDGRSINFTADASAAATSASVFTLFVQGRSLLDVFFSIAEDTPYVLAAQLREAGYTESVAAFTLTKTGVGVVETATSNPGVNANVETSGVLTPGQYRLVVEAAGKARAYPGQTDTGIAGCTFTLATGTATSCRADWNRDGRVDSTDLFQFMNDFMAGSADFDGSGVTDSHDFFAFLDAYFAGCP